MRPTQYVNRPSQSRSRLLVILECPPSCGEAAPIYFLFTASFTVPASEGEKHACTSLQARCLGLDLRSGSIKVARYVEKHTNSTADGRGTTFIPSGLRAECGKDFATRRIGASHFAPDFPAFAFGPLRNRCRARDYSRFPISNCPERKKN